MSEIKIIKSSDTLDEGKDKINHNFSHHENRIDTLEQNSTDGGTSDTSYEVINARKNPYTAITYTKLKDRLNAEWQEQNDKIVVNDTEITNAKTNAGTGTSYTTLQERLDAEYAAKTDGTGDTVTDSTINGNILVNSGEVIVYDDSNLSGRITTVEGNVGKLGPSLLPVSETGLTDGYVLSYDALNNQLTYVPANVGEGDKVADSLTNGNLIANHFDGTSTEIVVYDDSDVRNLIAGKSDSTHTHTYSTSDLSDIDETYKKAGRILEVGTNGVLRYVDKPSNDGTVVQDSAINGNIIADGSELQVFDQTFLQNDIESLKTNKSDKSHSHGLSTLSDVSAANQAINRILVWDGNNHVYQDQMRPQDVLDDTVTSTSYTYSSSYLSTNFSKVGHTHTFATSDLSDIDVTAKAAEKILKFDGTNHVYVDLPTGGNKVAPSTKRLSLLAQRDTFRFSSLKGLTEGHPEQTRPAYLHAARHGFESFTAKVRLTSDGEFVLIQDSTVDRTTNGTGNVNAKTLADIKLLDGGSWFHLKYSGERILEVGEYLELVRRYNGIAYIQLMDASFTSTQLTNLVNKIKGSVGVDNVVIIHGDTLVLNDIRTIDSNITLCVDLPASYTQTDLDTIASNTLNLGNAFWIQDAQYMSTMIEDTARTNNIRLEVSSTGKSLDAKTWVDKGVTGYHTSASTPELRGMI